MKFLSGIAVIAFMHLLTSCGEDSSSSIADSTSKDKNAKREYDTLTDERDGQTYRTVKIGTLTWMAENLNYETDSSYCYHDSTSYCDKYGRLYVWNAANAVCPEGWHLPNNDEWNTLFELIGDSTATGTPLKSTSGWFENKNGTDEYGFAAIPGGYRDEGGYNDYESRIAYFWSASENGESIASYIYFLFGNSIDLNPKLNIKDRGMSVRCVKN